MALHPNRRITITWATSYYRVGVNDGIRVRFDASNAVDMPVRIFAFRMLPLNPRTGEEAGHFDHVCSPVDLADYPEDAPRVGIRPEWFRLTFADLMVRSMVEVDALVTAVLEDVRRLKATLDLMDTLLPGEVDQVGLAPDETPSPSEAPSDSHSDSSEDLEPLNTVVAYATSATSAGQGEYWVEHGTGVGEAIGSESSDGSNFYRTVLTAKNSSRLLILRGFELAAMPTDAEIVGIEARLVIAHSGASELGDSLDSESAEDIGPLLTMFQLYHPDLGPAGQNKATGQLLDGPAFHSISLGGDTDNWGHPMKAAELKRSDAGVCLLVHQSALDEAATVDVDGVQLIITYR